MNLIILCFVAVICLAGGVLIKEPSAHAVVMVQNIFDAPIPKSAESERIDKEAEKARMLKNAKKAKCTNILKNNKNDKDAYETLRLEFCEDLDEETGLPYWYVPTFAELHDKSKKAPTPPQALKLAAEATLKGGKS
jgi:hypothetical protein